MGGWVGRLVTRLFIDSSVTHLLFIYTHPPTHPPTYLPLGTPPLHKQTKGLEETERAPGLCRRRGGRRRRRRKR